MLEAIETALFYTGAASTGIAVGSFIGGITWNHIKSSHTELPIYQDLPRGTY